MKIQTFKKGEDDNKVNEFLAANTVLGFNILQDGGIMIQYQNEIIGEKEIREYHLKEISDNIRQQAVLELDLAYEDKIKPDAETGKRKRTIQEKIDKLQIEESILREKLA